MTSADLPPHSLSPNQHNFTSSSPIQEHHGSSHNGPTSPGAVPGGADEPLTLLPEVAATGRPAGSRRPFQRRRRSRACDACRARKTKCDTPDSGPCSACAAASLVCKFTEGVEDRRRAGPARRIRALEQQVQDLTRKLHDAEARLRATPLGYPAIPVDIPSPATVTAPPPPGVSWREHHDRSPPPWPGDAGYPGPAAILPSQGPTYHLFDTNPQFPLQYKEHLQNLGYPPSEPLPEPYNDTPLVPLLSDYPSDPSGLTPKGQPTDLRALLPEKGFTDRLLEVFRRTIQTYRPIFYWPLWKERYDRAWDGEMLYTDRETVKAVFCPLMMVLAVACQMVRSEDAELGGDPLDETKERSWEYFHIGRKYADFNGPVYGIDDVLVLHLMSLYLSKASLIDPACSVSAAASRTALRLRLHEASTTQLPPPIYEARKRLFWSVYIEDMKRTLLTGLPPILSHDSVTITLPSLLNPSPTPTPQPPYLDLNNPIPHPIHASISSETSTSIRCLTAQINTSLVLSSLPRIILTDLGSVSDINTLQSIDESLKRTWEQFPSHLTDLQDPPTHTPLEVGALRPLFHLQYARLLLYRFFTEPPNSPLSPTFRSICFAQSVQAAKITAHLITRTGVPHKSYGLLIDELGAVHTFRVAVILLIALYARTGNEAILPISESELAIVVRALEEVARAGRRQSWFLEAFDVLARMVGYVRESERRGSLGDVPPGVGPGPAPPLEKIKMETTMPGGVGGWYPPPPGEEGGGYAAPSWTGEEQAVGGAQQGIDWDAVQEALGFEGGGRWTPSVGVLETRGQV